MTLDPSPTPHQEAQLLQTEFARYREPPRTDSARPYPTKLTAHLVIATRADITKARQTTLQVTTGLGFNDTEADQVAATVTELATHLFDHAGGGTLQLNTVTRLHQPGIEVIVDIDGPNRADIAFVLNPQWMDELVITSTVDQGTHLIACLLYTSPSPRDGLLSRMPSSA